jgi:micrococcal nuclease
MTYRRAATALLLALTLTSCTAPTDEQTRPMQLVHPDATAAPATPGSKPPAPARAPGVYPVDRVVDGDTVRILRDGKSVALRLIGGDTPETVHPSKPVQCFGPEASAEAKRLLAGKKVKVIYDPTQGEPAGDGRRVDYYDRDLVYLELPDGRDFMQHMIEQGYAEEYTYRGSKYQRHTVYNAAETEAMTNGRGLWSAC